MFGQQQQYRCLVYPRPHPSLLPALTPEQRAFITQWRHVLDQQPPNTSDDARPAASVTPAAALSVDQSAAPDSAVVPSAISTSTSSFPSSDCTSPSSALSPSASSFSLSTSSQLIHSDSISTPPQPVTSVEEISQLWSSLSADMSLPAADIISSFCAQLREVLLHLHRSRTSDDCLPAVVGELERIVLRTRAQLKKRDQPSNTPSVSIPLDRHIQLQILLRLALPAIPPPHTDSTAATEGAVDGSTGVECDSEQLVELFELLQSITSERDTLTFFRSVVVPAFAATQAEALKRLCAEMGWAQPLELKGVEQAPEEEPWVESEEEDLDDMLQLHTVRLTQTEILPIAAPLATQQLHSCTISSASSTTARTNSLSQPATFQPIRHSSLPTAPSAPSLLKPSLYPPSASSSTALSQLRQQRMREQLRHQEQYDRKLKRAREGISEEEEKVAQQHKRQQQERLRELTKVERFVSNKVRIATRLPAAVVLKKESKMEERRKVDEVAAVRRKGVRQLDFTAQGKQESSASTDSSSARSSSLSSMSSAATCTDQSGSPVAFSGTVEFVAETPMTRGVRGHASGSSGRMRGSNPSQRSGGRRSKRNLAALLEQQAVP